MRSYVLAEIVTKVTRFFFFSAPSALAGLAILKRAVQANIRPVVSPVGTAAQQVL